MLRPGGRVAGKPGVTSTEGDFDDPASLRGALEGVDRAFLLTNSTGRTEAQLAGAETDACVDGVVWLRGDP
jgi:uncharacterized protein YbjT (DUF2867 family)